MQSQDRSVEDTSINSTFRPDLFVVPGGSYASNVVYGSGVEALSPSYNGVTVRLSTNSLGQTEGYIRQNDKISNFELQVVLDTSLPDPWPQSTNELRIRTLPPLSNEPASRYNKILIPEDGLPLIQNVEILDQNGRNLLPQANSILQARYLFGSELALIRKNLLVPNTVVPVLTSDLSPFFGSETVTSVRIIIRASYLSVPNPTGH